MAAVELEIPEVKVDQPTDPFKRRVAVLVAAITFLGSVVGYLHVRDSNREEAAARESQRQAITGLGAQSRTSAEFQSNYEVYTNAKLAERRATVARTQARFTPTASGRLELNGERWAQVRQSFERLTPLLHVRQYSEDEDKHFPNRYESRIMVEPELAKLREAARAELAEAHGAKADGYVTVITILAVSLFLIGLSLIVAGGGRKFLLVAGAGLAGFCLVGAGLITARGVSHTPEKAIQAVAEGRRLMWEGKWDEAVAAFDRAIRARPDYAVAYGDRADAHYRRGGAGPLDSYVSITSPESLEASIKDNERALQLGAGNDGSVVASQAWNYFLVGRYDDSARLSKQALRLNDKRAFIWFNLGVAQVAQGQLDLAIESYDRGIALTAEGDKYDREDLFSTARTDLELLARARPERRDAVRRFSEKMTAADAGLVLETTATPPPPRAAVTGVELYQDDGWVWADHNFDGIPAGTAMSYIWHFRPSPDQPWNEAAVPNQHRLLESTDGSEFSLTRPAPCKLAGQYRVDIYAGGKWMAAGEVTLEAAFFGEMEEVDDEVVGVSFCSPTRWAPEDEEDMLAYEGEDGTLGAATVVVPSDIVGSSPAAFVDSVLRNIIGVDPAGFEDIELDGLDGRLAVVQLGPQGQGRVAAAAALGSDQVLRVAIFSAASREEFERIQSELVPTIEYR